MKHLSLCLCGLLMFMLSAATLKAESAIEGLSPQMILVQARSMFPQEQLQVTGTLETAEARGLNAVIRPYTLSLNWHQGSPSATCAIFDDADRQSPVQRALLKRENGITHLTLFNAEGVQNENVRLNTPVADTDLTWMDLTFNYLWWTNVQQLSEAALEARALKARQGGRNCVVLEAFPPKGTIGLHSVLLWIDISTGYLVQTEQTDAHQRVVRRMWVQRIGREEGRWVPREFRIQREGMRRVTKLIIATIQSEAFSVKELN